MKLHVAGLVAALISLAGLLLQIIPVAAAHIPAQYAWVVTIVGLCCQALTKGVQHGDTILVPRSEELPPNG